MGTIYILFVNIADDVDVTVIYPLTTLNTIFTDGYSDKNVLLISAIKILIEVYVLSGKLIEYILLNVVPSYVVATPITFVLLELRILLKPRGISILFK